jgi:hypothetical protein
MPLRLIIFATLLLAALVAASGESAATKLKVHVTHFGYPGDPQASSDIRLGLGDHNNILNNDSVAVTSDIDQRFPFGSKVHVAGKFLGFRHATLSPKLHHTIAVYDPKGAWVADFESYVEPAARK